MVRPSLGGPTKSATLRSSMARPPVTEAPPLWLRLWSPATPSHSRDCKVRHPTIIVLRAGTQPGTWQPLPTSLLRPRPIQQHRPSRASVHLPLLLVMQPSVGLPTSQATPSYNTAPAWCTEP